MWKSSCTHAKDEAVNRTCWPSATCSLLIALLSEQSFTVPPYRHTRINHHAALLLVNSWLLQAPHNHSTAHSAHSSHSAHSAPC